MLPLLFILFVGLLVIYHRDAFEAFVTLEGTLEEDIETDDQKTIFLAKKNSLEPITGDYEVKALTTDLMNNNPYQQIDWRNVYVFGKPHQLKVKPKPKPLIILSDACSTLGSLNSDFKEDICTKYAGDAVTIDQKCQDLSAKNCTIPRCCVLLDGKRCMAGDANGPTFLTQEGESLDYAYYHLKDKCYGDCPN
jgi:hypothetical protein